MSRRGSRRPSTTAGLPQARGPQLFPQAADMCPGRAKLPVAAPPLKTVGPYTDAATLLRAHQALLAEDFLRALAAQLDDIRGSPAKRQAVLGFEVTVSELGGKHCSSTSSSNNVRVQLHQPGRYRSLDKDDKRFMTHNLVLLAAGAAMVEPLVGVIVKSDRIQHGELVVMMTTGLDRAGHFIPLSRSLYINKVFFMVESEPFHFPALHVTNALRADAALADRASGSTAVSRLSAELVRCQFPSPMPAYLSLCRRWGGLVHQLCKGLNASQVKALNAVLAHRVALVQGPPGTGKTFLGVKLVEFLVNLKRRNPKVLRSPILLITTTNHAVDEFLTRCTPFTKKIIHGYSEHHDRKDYGPLQKEYDSCSRGDERQHLMAEADIVAMTTTRAAYMRSALDELRIKIVLVEEAAEALEGYVLACLPKDTEHLVQIGDHKQLQPSCSHQPLGESHRLNLSLFERLILNGAECVMLNEQRRMRPEISRLVRSIYPTLTDHPTTWGRDIVSGVNLQIPVLFVSRPDPETSEGKGYKSLWQAEMAARLANYLVLQGYSNKDITILSTYRKQLNLIQKKVTELEGDARSVRVTTVDNFQGEENKIIILSLVRSNPRGCIGFLALENRACVALSRARDGFFMLGNLDCLVASGAPIWTSVYCELAAYHRVQPALPLVCPHGRHFACASAEDIEVAEGGCVVCVFVDKLEDAKHHVKDVRARIKASYKEIKAIDRKLADLAAANGKKKNHPGKKKNGLQEDGAAKLVARRGQLEATVEQLTEVDVPALVRARDEAKAWLKRVESLWQQGHIDVASATVETVENLLLPKQRRQGKSGHGCRWNKKKKKKVTPAQELLIEQFRKLGLHNPSVVEK